MPYGIIITKGALKEYSEAALWYDEQRIGLGEQFISTVRAKLVLIAENPELFSNKHRTYREVKIDSVFPYQIVYRVDMKGKRIVVSAIFHTSRKPKKKYRKL